MTKIIHAGFQRLFKLKVLYICFALIFYIDGIDLIFEYISAESKDQLPDIEGYLLSGFLAVVIFSAVFITFFLGSEYTFGTIRNKMIVGHGRLAVYLGNFVLCYTAVMMMYAWVWLLVAALGIPMLGGFGLGTSELLEKLLLSFLGITALTALYVLIAMCIHSKSLSAVIAIMAAFIMMISSVMTIQILSEPEYIPAAQLSEEYSQNTFKPSPDDPSLVSNPNYVTGTRRKVYKLIHELCPVTQILDGQSGLTAKRVLIPLGELALAAAAGIVVFKKRDLK